MKNRQYAIWTLVFVIGLVVWFAFSHFINSTGISVPAQAVAQDQTAASPTGDEDAAPEHSWLTYIAWGLVFATATAAIIVLGRLQHRRAEAFREAAKRAKAQARTPTRSTEDLDS